MNIKAFRIKQPNKVCYITCLPLIDVLNKMQVDEWGVNNRFGYQRPLDPRRLGKGQLSIIEGIENGITNPNGIVINTRETLHFTEESSLGNLSHGYLDIPDYVNFWIIDGRHRIEAYKKIANQDKDFFNSPIGLTIFNFLDIGMETELFLTLNSSTLSLNNGIIYRNIQNIGRQRGEQYILENLGLDNLITYRAIEFTDILCSRDDSPFKDRISYYGNDKKKYHFIKDVDMITIIKQFYTKYVAIRELDRIIYDFIIYWNAVKKIYSICYENNDAYSLFDYAGIYVFSLLFVDIDDVITEKTRENYIKYLSKLNEITDKHPQIMFRTSINVDLWKKQKENAIFNTRNPQILNYLYYNLKKKMGL